MKTQEEVVAEMQEGFQTLEEYCSGLDLSFNQNLKITGLSIFAMLYRSVFSIYVDKAKIAYC